MKRSKASNDIYYQFTKHEYISSFSLFQVASLTENYINFDQHHRRFCRFTKSLISRNLDDLCVILLVSAYELKTRSVQNLLIPKKKFAFYVDQDANQSSRKINSTGIIINRTISLLFRSKDTRKFQRSLMKI